MQNTEDHGTPPPGAPAPRKAARRTLWALLALVVIASSGGRWYYAHGGLEWRDAVNPVYWWQRFHGDDLYNPEESLLMHGNRLLPEIALTFDDGPHKESLPSILATLRRCGIHATFFNVGVKMAESPYLVRSILAGGHEIGNHTYNHQRLIYLTPRQRHREMNDTDITYFRITGRHLNMLRPPGERYNPTILREARKLGYTIIGYSAQAHDYDPAMTADYIADRALERADRGGIMLLHDYKGTAAALPRIIDGLRSKGYRFVTISQMLAHLPDPRAWPRAPGCRHPHRSRKRSRKMRGLQTDDTGTSPRETSVSETRRQVAWTSRGSFRAPPAMTAESSTHWCIGVIGRRTILHIDWPATTRTPRTSRRRRF